MRAALAEVGGAVNAAARQLGISTRTLQRRLKETPSLRPEPRNPLWDKAIENRNDILSTADENIFNPNVSSFSKLWRHVDWEEYELQEAVTRQLDEQSVVALVSDLRTSDIVRIEYGQSGLPKLMPHLIERKL